MHAPRWPPMATYASPHTSMHSCIYVHWRTHACLRANQHTWKCTDPQRHRHKLICYQPCTDAMHRPTLCTHVYSRSPWIDDQDKRQRELQPGNNHSCGNNDCNVGSALSNDLVELAHLAGCLTSAPITTENMAVLPAHKH